MAYEKLDGSLGILYWLNDEPFIATRGSFDSVQARWASAQLRTQYAHALPHLDRSQTYLFEIIYPDNRVVVNYGNRAELVLLAQLDTATGAEADMLPAIGFPLVRQFHGLTDLTRLRAVHLDNAEGFVLRYRSGLRVKVKFAEYVRLHRLMTDVSSRVIWDYLATDQPFDALLERVPDEFYDWVKATVTDLEAQFRAIETSCWAALRTGMSRKELADHYWSLPHAKLLFLMHDGKAYRHVIWRLVKPAYERPFWVNGVPD